MSSLLPGDRGPQLPARLAASTATAAASGLSFGGAEGAMYSWDEDTSGWLGKASYAFSEAGKGVREVAAARAAAAGPRTYEAHRGPNPALIDPKKRVSSDSKNPLIVAVDVTGA